MIWWLGIYSDLGNPNLGRNQPGPGLNRLITGISIPMSPHVQGSRRHSHSLQAGVKMDCGWCCDMRWID